MWRSHAEAEGLTLRVADNKTGYFGVYHQPGKLKPCQAQVRRGGKVVSLGSFAIYLRCVVDYHAKAHIYLSHTRHSYSVR